MSTTEKIIKFINSPFPLWENDLTTDLVGGQWKTFEQYGIWPYNYTTAKGLYWDRQLPDSFKKLVWGNNPSTGIQLESAEKTLHKFYYDTGLEIVELSTANSPDIVKKLTEAFKMLDMVPGMMDCISQLIKTIQIIKQDDPEIDTSHTDPEIPFSIFVSVCNDTSEISNLRVAESILHEAMHLKLTLIEKHLDLIVPATDETCYSPWRDEQRPVRGVLHGLFVFISIREFYKTLYLKLDFDERIRGYLERRINDITSEIQQIQNFKKSQGFTKFGENLCTMLLQ